MRKFTLKWEVISREEGMLVREFLRMKGISKAALTDIKFRGGVIQVGGTTVNVRHPLRRGDELLISYPTEERSEGMESEAIPLDIVYEDDYVIVLNKQPYMSTIPSREHPNGTVANALLYHYDQQQIPSTVHVVTRLDRDTSGLMLIAKHRFIHHLLSQQQQKKTIRRTYEALVHGKLQQEEGTIDAPIARKEDSIIERTVRIGGQEAITHFRVLQQWEDMTHVALELETGRTHQIRVHMSYLGYPLLGDDLYGGKRDRINRQALHSNTLTFYHPMLERELTFYAELPLDMKELIERASD
ncbi:RluA family pseudouridine synthase [Microbacteriaceae bacterium 4G12]